MAKKTVLDKENTKRRVQKYRKKIYENPVLKKTYLSKNASSAKKYREKLKKLAENDSAVKMQQKINERERKRKFRENKKQQTVKNIPFKTPQSLGKAVRRADAMMPKEKNKKICVLTKILESLDPNLKVQNIGKTEIITTMNPWNKLSPEIVEKVKSFYLKEDISRVSPGLKDRVKIKTNGSIIEYAQKRHMVYTIKEAYTIFQEENPETKIQIRKFYELRPAFVLPISDTPHNVCVCKYHSNILFILEAFRKRFKTFPDDHKKLISEITCDVESENCMMNECPQCKEFDILFSCLPLQYNPEEPMQIKQWSTIDGKTKTIIQLETIESAIEMLEKQMTPFRKHHFVKNIQQKYFDFKRKNIEIGDVILQIDFAENFQLIAQDEIQSAHWQHEQVTIFTAVAWLAEKIYSFSIISNYLVHDKYAVYVFLKKIISWIEFSGYKVKDLSVFSDGCAAQFKNRFILSTLCFLPKEINITSMEWSFFATSHGKGAVDGVGATVKRKVCR